MTSRSIIFTLTTFGFLALSNPVAIADVIRVEFEGEITSFQLGSHPFWDDRIQVGDIFSGYYEYEEANALSTGCSSSGLQCSWYFKIPPHRFAFTLDGITTVVDSGEYYIRNTRGVPGITETFFETSVNGPAGLLHWEDSIVLIGMVDDSNTAISDPTTLFVPNPNDFVSTRVPREDQFQILGGFDNILGKFTRFEAVPEPTNCGWVFGSFFVFLRKRSERSQKRWCPMGRRGGRCHRVLSCRVRKGDGG